MLQQEEPRGTATTARAAAPGLATVVVLCLVTMMLEGYEVGALGNVVPVLAKDWSLAPQSFTWALTASSIGMVFGAVASGIIANHAGRRLVLVACVGLFAIGSLLCAATVSPATMGLARVVTGLGLGGVVPIAIASTTSACRGRRQGLLVMIMSAGLPLGQILGGLLASWLVRVSVWQTVFLFGGIVALVVLAPLLWRYLPLGDAAADRAVEEGEVLHGRDLAKLFAPGRAAVTVLLWLIVFLNFTCNYFVISWLPTILNSSGMEAEGAISFATLYPLGGVIAILCLGWLLDTWGMERTLGLSLFIGAVAVFLLGAVNAQVGVMALLVAILGIGVAGSQSAINALTTRVYPRDLQNAGSGWALGVGRIGNAAGPLLGGGLIAAGLTTQQLFLGLSVPVLITSLVMLSLGVLRRGRARRMPELIEGVAL